MRAAAVAGGTGLSAGAEVRRESPGSGAPGGVFPPRRAQGVLRGHKGAADALRAAGGGGSGGPGGFRIGASGKFRLRRAMLRPVSRGPAASGVRGDAARSCLPWGTSPWAGGARVGSRTKSGDWRGCAGGGGL